jgi:hypothetical protein
VKESSSSHIIGIVGKVEVEGENELVGCIEGFNEEEGIDVGWLEAH